MARGNQSLFLPVCGEGGYLSSELVGTYLLRETQDDTAAGMTSWCLPVDIQQPSQKDMPRQLASARTTQRHHLKRPLKMTKHSATLSLIFLTKSRND